MLETKQLTDNVFEMTKPTMIEKSDKFDDLRKRAEETLQGRPIDLQSLTAEEAGRLLHELQIHQIELEIQNEELRTTQQVLEESRNKYSDLYDFAPIGYFTIEEQGVILEANLTGAYLLGRETRALLNKPFALFIAAEDRHIYYEHCQKVFRTKSRQFCELRLLKKDGSLFFAQLESAVVADWEGNISQCRIVISDITERRESAEALRQGEKRFQRLIGSLSDHIYVGKLAADGQWTTIYTSPNVEDLTGYPREKFTADWHFWQTLIHPDDRAIAENHQVQLGQSTEVEYRLYRSDDAIIWIRDSRQVEVERDKDSQVSQLTVYGVVSDITERKLAEAELQKERTRLAQRVEERTADLRAANEELARAIRLKDEFLANMSHELRTPLNAILGRTEMLLEGLHGDLSSKQNKSLKTIEESAKHLLDLISDILDVSKIEAGVFELELDWVSPQSLCQACLRLIKEAAHKKNLKVISTFDIMVNKVMADERRLKQILVNLLSNAIKFTPDGGTIGLEVSLDPAQDLINFTVWDTGIGIAAENMDRLFQPFVQLDSSLSRAYDGTGLGLTMVHRLTRLHGGRVSVESQVGQGSRFTASIPRQGSNPQKQIEPVGDVVNSIAAPVITVAAPEIVMDDQPTILVAEDNQVTIDMLLDYLPSRGYHLVVATNGIQAFEMAKENQPALILMDIQMSGSDGLETIRKIRQEEALMNTPIVAMTALAMPGDRERCLEAGADEYLSKPVSLKKLHEVIEARLNETEC